MRAMRVDELSIDVPVEQIGRVPLADRDQCRLMVFTRATGAIEHAIFRDIAGFLDPGDLLVANDSQVIPCRLPGRRADGRELLVVLVSRRAPDVWCCQVRPARGLGPGERLFFGEGVTGELLEPEQIGPMTHWIIRFTCEGDFYAAVEKIGELALPVFADQKVRERALYDTVYAREPGSGLPPTAGLHFTPRVIDSLAQAGIDMKYITLHIGLGSAPITVEHVEDHVMHGEEIEVPPDTAEAVNRARAAGKRVVAIGTTVARTLETAADGTGRVRPMKGMSDLYMYPGYRVRCITGLVTNLHPPRSTGLLVTAALIGVDLMKECYRRARDAGYRFYDFGDALLIR
ncbi:MAG: tRNA preQ1(34) S-adenosylmethionine ribosyltransferase-isomerase QueA [Acetobacteraceae bacterium]|nr:tRNA preQ1(34) S-adenosylmethionine ribosyltransferase-isomerase QueA [Acetobacteraceae bacterium]